MSAAQTAAGSGGEPLTTRRRAGAQAGTVCGRRPRVIACKVGRDALVAMAALPVAAQAQVVGADGSLEAGQPADQAAPVSPELGPPSNAVGSEPANADHRSGKAHPAKEISPGTCSSRSHSSGTVPSGSTPSAPRAGRCPGPSSPARTIPDLTSPTSLYPIGPSPLGQCRLHTVKQFGDHVRLEPGQRHSAGAITTAR